MRKRLQATGIAMLIVSVLLAGCMGSDDVEKEVVEEKLLYEESISTLTFNDHVEASIWTGTGAIAIDIDGVVIGYPSAEISRPEHFHKAWIEVHWNSSSQDVFETARAAAGSAPSFSSPWDTDSGTGVLNLEVDEHLWANGGLLVELYPGDNTDSLSSQVEVEVEFRVTLMEHVPITDPEEEPEEERSGRGSNQP